MKVFRLYSEIKKSQGGDELSFSYEVKEELARILPPKCCQKAEILSFIRMAGSLRITGGQKGAVLQIQTEHASTAKKIYTLLKKLTNSQIEISIKENSFLKENRLYIVSSKMDEIKLLLKELGLITKDEKSFNFEGGTNNSVIAKRCCKRAYLRGAFLGSGSISDPKGSYHMEFVTTSKGQAEVISDLIKTFGLNCGIMERKNKYMVYLKDGDNISDLLAIMGAHNALLKFEDIRVVKEVRNSVNRIVNCETANLNKIIDASVRQIESIKFLKQKKVYDKLPDNLKQIAELRLEYPDLSLKELGQFLTPPLGKSGVSYRLKKIEQIAEILQDAEKEKKMREGNHDKT